MSEKLLVVGEACGDDGVPLCGPSGRRLGRLVGLTLEEFLDSVEVVNVLSRCPGRSNRGKGFNFPLDLAREGAAGLPVRGRVVLLLGQRVCRAFGVRGQLRPPERLELGRGELTAWVVPHPSGIVRFWNSEENRRAAGRVLRRLLRETGVW